MDFKTSQIGTFEASKSFSDTVTPKKSIKQLDFISCSKPRTSSKKSTVLPSKKELAHSASTFQLDPNRDLVLQTKEKNAETYVPFFITVMGENGKLLLNVYANQKGKREVQLFYNKGNYNDGLQIVRSCLRNMLSFDFKNIVALNVFRGFYLAVQTCHNKESIRGYYTNPKYKNNIGLLEYVDMNDIHAFAKDCNAIVNPKLEQYCEELLDYIQTCKNIAKVCN
jgi:hypothetical protein